tara:strand:- start:626 stop:913 length:288 start_codon:yes stop_codon:yes gene_type:complete
VKNKDFYHHGKLVKHSYRPEWGTGIIKGQRTKEKFDKETGEGGLFVQQYKVWFSVGGEGWFDAAVLLWLPTDEQTRTGPEESTVTPDSPRESSKA